MNPASLSPLDLETIVQAALREDLPHGDITTNTLISEEAQTHAKIVAKQDFTLAGMAVAQKVYEVLDPSISLIPKHEDGDVVGANQIIATLQGRATSILTGERVALNFLQHLSGVASMTARFCEAIRGYPTKILDTRKTIPGLRLLEKWAVRLGGGTNHRMSLSDGILIKDNHLAFLKSQETNLVQACRLAKSHGPHELRVCVEVDTLAQIPQALEGQADVILLDNMTPDMVQQAVSLIKGRALIEVSGGVTLNNVREYAASGVDYISIGALTQSAPAVDISLDLEVSGP